MSEFKGFATPSTVIGTVTSGDYYIASEDGTYTNFGNSEIIKVDSRMVALQYNGSTWDKLLWDIPIDGILRPKAGSTTTENVTIFTSFLQTGKKIKIYEELDFGGATIDFTSYPNMEIEIEKGGMLKNVTLNCNDTWFDMKPYQIFDNVTFDTSGTPRCKEGANPLAWGATLHTLDTAKANCVDSSEALNACNKFGYLAKCGYYYPAGKFGIESPIHFRDSHLESYTVIEMLRSAPAEFTGVIIQNTEDISTIGNILSAKVADVTMDVFKNDNEIKLSNTSSINKGDVLIINSGESARDGILYPSELGIQRAELLQVNDVYNGVISIYGSIYENWYKVEHDAAVYKITTTNFINSGFLQVNGMGDDRLGSGIMISGLANSTLRNLKVVNCVSNGISRFHTYRCNFYDCEIADIYGRNQSHGYGWIDYGCAIDINVYNLRGSNCRHECDFSNGFAWEAGRGRKWNYNYIGGTLTNDSFYSVGMIGDHEGVGSMKVYGMTFRGNTKQPGTIPQWVSGTYQSGDIVKDIAIEGNGYRFYIAKLTTDQPIIIDQVSGDKIVNEEYWESVNFNWAYYVRQINGSNSFGLTEYDKWGRFDGLFYESLVDSNTTAPDINPENWRLLTEKLAMSTGITTRKYNREITIENCKFYNVYSPISFPSYCDNFIIKNCYIDNCYSVYSPQEQSKVTIDGLYIKEGAFMSVETGNYNGLESTFIINNLTLDNGNFNPWSGGLWDNTKSLVINNLVIKNSVNRRFLGFKAKSELKNIEINGCKVINSNSTVLPLREAAGHSVRDLNITINDLSYHYDEDYDGFDAENYFGSILDLSLNDDITVANLKINGLQCDLSNLSDNASFGVAWTGSSGLDAKIENAKILNSEIKVRSDAYPLFRRTFAKNIYLSNTNINEHPLSNDTNNYIIIKQGDHTTDSPIIAEGVREPNYDSVNEYTGIYAAEGSAYTHLTSGFKYIKTTDFSQRTGWILQPKTNYTATAAPTVTDDESEGYGVGSEWFYNGIWYKLADNTEGAAVWNALN